MQKKGEGSVYVCRDFSQVGKPGRKTNRGTTKGRPGDDGVKHGVREDILPQLL